mmetsp:Transcript_25956/g.56361  ORF Transcript_25956/g.56361 Transcript_25956/m.56361 type:complete len:257 (+) Transcript_25956:190-960(+)
MLTEDISRPADASVGAVRSTSSSSSSRPSIFGGYARKPKRGLSWITGLNCRTRRYFWLQNGRLYWVSCPAMMSGSEGMKAKRSSIDFGLTPTLVEAREDQNVVVLMPSFGRVWSHRDRHSRRGTQEEFALDITGSGHTVLEWAHHIRLHIAFALVRPCRRRNLAQALTPVLFDSNLDGEVCPICLESLGCEECGPVVESRCKHRFHRSCCHEWLLSEGSCPICRTQLLSEDCLRTNRGRMTTYPSEIRSIPEILRD